MKIFAFIMAMYIFALAGYPCCENDNCTGEKAKIEKTSNSNPDIPKDDCENCSPFFSCCTGSGFTLQAEQICTTPLVFEVVINASVYKNNFRSQFCGSIWQPPKLV